VADFRPFPTQLDIFIEVYNCVIGTMTRDTLADPLVFHVIFGENVLFQRAQLQPPSHLLFFVVLFYLFFKTKQLI